jgi:hypothetical protein
MPRIQSSYNLCEKTSCDPTATPANAKPGLLEDERNLASAAIERQNKHVVRLICQSCMEAAQVIICYRAIKEDE